MTPTTLLPDDERARLRSLHYHLLEPTFREPIFQELAQLTARIFNLPVSLISLVAEEQVTYFGNEGAPELISQPRVEAVCTLAVQQRKLVLFTDLQQPAQADQLTPQALAAARVRNFLFYAGVPLLLPDHRAIGTLCVLDHQPREFSPGEQAVLARLAHLVAQTLVVRHYCLSEGLGEEHWQTVQALLVEEVGALAALVRYLVSRFGTQIPVAPHILEQVSRRLADLGALLTDYHQAKRA